MRSSSFVRAAGAVGLVFSVALGTGVGAAAAAPAHGSHRQGPASVRWFDGSYSGTTYRYASRIEHPLGTSPAQLHGGSVTFTTTVTSDENAALWDDSTAELVIAGFRQARHSAKLEGDGSLIYAQDNSMGAGYCANDQFETASGGFVFGAGAACYTHSTPPYGSTETYSVTLNGDNTFTDTVTVATSSNLVGFTCNGSSCSVSFSGTLSAPPTTRYFPALYMLPGRVSSDPTTTWTFSVTGSSYSRS